MGAGAGKARPKSGSENGEQTTKSVLDPERKRSLQAKVRSVVAFSNMAPNTSVSSGLSQERRESRQAMLDFMRAQRRENTVAWNSILDTQSPLDAVAEGDEIGALSKVECETNCHLCGEEAFNEAVSCRVCVRCFHIQCLEQSGHVRHFDHQFFGSKQGWSCYICSNLVRMLSTEQTADLHKDFEKINQSSDGRISWPEFRRYKNAEAVRLHGEALSEEQIQELQGHFRQMDMDRDDHIDWSDFSKHGAGQQLKLKSKEELVKLLTPKELEKARRRYECKIQAAQNRRRDCDPEENDEPWQEYLESHAHTILMERPNQVKDWLN